jgi:murein DD-endopeptidase MepM/ murein hydrolase activator NlpD
LIFLQLCPNCGKFLADFKVVICGSEFLAHGGGFLTENQIDAKQNYNYMKILLLSGRHHKSGSTYISPLLLVSVLLFVIISISGTASWLAYNMGHEDGFDLGLDDARFAAGSGLTLQSSIKQQRMEWEQTQKNSREYLNAMALKLGELQSHIVRLNALGERLAKMGKLDETEFDFKNSPAVGGFDLRGDERYMELSELVGGMESMSREIEDRDIKLDLLEDLIMNNDLQKDVRPTNYPVKSSYISSGYGERADPFTGVKAFHKGVDFPGRTGSKVMAAGSGIVIFSGEQRGYGKVIKVDHGNDIVTLYAHNSKLLAKVGDYVSKGQQIAAVGSSGRSLKPHLHFEVRHDGNTVDPIKFIQASN